QQQSSYNDSNSLSQQHQYAQLPPTSSLQQSAYPPAFSSNALNTSPQHQHSAHQENNQLYQAPSQIHNPAAQYVSHDQQTSLAPLQFGNLGVIGQQRPTGSFPYEFDPNDSNCRNIYSAADMDSPHHGSGQVSNSGYIRHGPNSILVSAGHPQAALASVHSQQQHQQSLDMAAAAAAANLALPVDISGDHGIQGQHQHQQMHHTVPIPGMHASTPQTPFGSSSSNGQPMFGALNFQASQLQDFDSYTRPKRNGRVTKPKRTPRPPNAFILYRKAKQAEVIRDNPGVSNKDVSCIIGQMWKSEDPTIQDQFREQAEMEKKKHKELHPNYKYQPRKPKNKRLQEAQAAGVAASNGSLASGPSQDGSFVSGTVPMVGSSSVLSSGIKDSSISGNASGSFQPYSKYHLMMQPGHGQQQSAHSQTPASQQHVHVSRGDEYYYRGADQMVDPQQHVNSSFVGVAPQLDIKPSGFVGGIPNTAYWTPNTPGDGTFPNSMSSGNVFHGDQAPHMRPFDSSVVQHPSAGHAMGTSPAHMLHPFDHQRQAQAQAQAQHHHHHHHHQQQHQQMHDSRGPMDYPVGQQQQYHQHHGHSQQHQQQQQASLGGYVNGSQSYHHSQPGMDSLDGAPVTSTDSQGLGLLSPPAVAWSANM
ncbi:hypothetical protein LPJ66_010900, partial [Kickxella alabastrina]